MTVKAQIIDVFAGPGGLGEGFSAYQDENGNYPFQIKISVEMEQFAHKTLRLRSFVRYFIHQDLPLPQIYIDYVSGFNFLLGKMLEFRIFDRIAGPIGNENDTRDWLILGPEHYCKQDYDRAKEHYAADWKHIDKAIKNAFYEARKMTLGPDEIAIHEAIKQRIDKNVPIILIGGPPCQAFSTVGRSRRKGHVTNHIVQNKEGDSQWDQDNDGRTWLYEEYIKIIHDFQPQVFVMENVRGMLSAKIDGDDGDKVHVWKRIFADLNQPGKTLGIDDEDIEYDIYSLASATVFKGDASTLTKLNGDEFVLHAEEYGIPQARERVILLGIRKDISNKLGDDFISCLSKVAAKTQTHVQDAIGNLPALRAGVGCTETYLESVDKTKRTSIKKDAEAVFWETILRDRLKDTLDRLGNSTNVHQHKVLGLLKTAYKFHSKLLNKPQSTKFIKGKPFETTAQSIDKFFDFTFTRLDKRIPRFDVVRNVDELTNWYSANNSLSCVLNHEARNHMDTDLCRYIYSACYTLIRPEAGEKTFPRLPELKEVGLDPKGHKNQASFIDRFRTQVWNKPATTVTSHISKDGHYYIHPDPSQMRSFTVREAARIQTFPDNYFFEGPRTAQYVQVGNAVPPLLANKVARVVHSVFVRTAKKNTVSKPQSRVCEGVS